MTPLKVEEEDLGNFDLLHSGFVTETELEEKKGVRQEEWERVRKPEDPMVAPEEPVDSRSLFERLEEQREKKQDEWDEEHKFKNQSRGHDDEEVDFHDRVDDVGTEKERQRYLDEKRELEEYQRRQQELKEKELEERLVMERKGPGFKRSTSTTSSKNSQLKLLAGADKRKGVKDRKVIDEKKTKEREDIREKKTKETPETTLEKKDSISEGHGVSEKPSCFGLLGLADYGSDSDSDQSS